MKKTITIISSICILLFLIAILWFGAGLYIDKKNGIELANTRYAKLLSETKLNFEQNKYGSSEFSNNFIKSIGNIDDFSSLKLEVNDSLLYSYPPSAFSLPSPKFTKTYSETVYLSEKSFTLTASIYLMSPYSVYKYSRFSFLLILSGTVLAGIFIVFLSGTQNDEQKFFKIKEPKKQKLRYKKIETAFPETESKSENSPLESFSEESVYSEEDLKDENIKPASEKISENESQEETIISFEDSSNNDTDDSYTPSFNPEEILSQSTEDNSFTENDFSEKFEAGSETDENETEQTSSELDIIDQLEQENQQFANEELFSDEPIISDEIKPATETASVSPVTNLNIQISLEEKLDEILSNNETVTLALVKINGLDRGNRISESVVNLLNEKANNPQIFEYKTDAYALLLKNCDLQTAVDTFENLYNEITDYLKENNSANEVSVGISSDCSRMIKAERLILEADQALEYASKDPDSPIVAFRANPDKYREYESSQS